MFDNNENPLEEIKYSRTIEIAPGITMLEGYAYHDFFKKYPSCNVFILRDGDTVLLLDSGLYPYYREKTLKILRNLKQDGVKHLIFTVMHSHFDHVANNKLIYEAGYDDVQFLLPEPEFNTIDLKKHFLQDMAYMEENLELFAANPEDPTTLLLGPVSNASKEAAKVLLGCLSTSMYQGVTTMAERAKCLHLNNRVSKKFGESEFQGWEIGRFFAIHDGAHSPGHISIYDPKYKVLITGDMTLEINPAFYDSNVNALIDYTARFRHLAEQGFVELATDSHRSSIWWPRIAEALDFEALGPMELVDVAHGASECATFFGMWEDYYRSIKEEILRTLANLGEATVHEIVEELKKSNSKAMNVKKALAFPNLPSRLETAVANVLNENGIPKRKEGDRILFAYKEEVISIYKKSKLRSEKNEDISY